MKHKASLTTKLLRELNLWRKVAKWVRRRWENNRYWAAKIVRRSDWLIALYYMLEGTFAWEQRATFELQVQADTRLNDLQASKYQLRRGVHRLEKGLIMRPRRDVFGEDYIGATVAYFARVQQEATGDPTVDWARDVLTEFFQAAAVGKSTIIDNARTAFKKTSSPATPPQGDSRPYVRDTSPLRIRIEDMQALAQRRRSVRWYTPTPVPRQVIDKAIDVARLSPSACNRQPFAFRIYDDPALVQQVSAIPMGTRNFAHNFPCVCVLVGDMNAFSAIRDRHVPYIDASLAAMAFQFALEVQGIGSCSINWPEMPEREKQMQDLLSLRPTERPIMLISLGYPDPSGMVPFSEKKPLDEIRNYNQLGEVAAPQSLPAAA